MRLDFHQEDLVLLAKALAPEVAKELKAILKPQNQDNSGDTILTPETLSTYLHISKDKIYSMTHLKEIPYFKVGRELRFKKADIDSWLQSSYTPAISGISNHFKGRVATCQK